MERNTLYRGGLVLLIGFIFLKFGGVLFRVICMNMLSVSAYGEVAIFLVLFNWFMLFATFNVTLGLAKFVSQDSSKKGVYYSAALIGSFVLALVITGVLLLLTPLLSSAINVSQGVVLWAVLTIPFAVVYNIGIFYFRGLYHMKHSTMTDTVMMIIRIAALVALLYAGLYYAPFFAFMVSFVVIDIYILFRNRGVLEYGGETLGVFKQLLIYSFPIFVSEFLRHFSMSFDRLALSGFYSTVEAGFYDAATALCLGYIIISNSYANALLPKASSSETNLPKRRKELLRALKASAALFVLYTVLLIILGRPVINIINPAYLGIFEFLPFMMIAYMIMGILVTLFFFSNSIGRQRYAVYGGAVFAFLSLTLNVYLVPVMLYMGAISALIISSLASLSVMGVLLWKSERS
ncbi:MAG: oligosaccharide flippase family protein [Candidatus Aenigmatarchaeota archaeon]|nr:MAG: oligosaccharide flippase family protein [Candidatus Aenigmarchaeota archaeon]